MSLLEDVFLEDEAGEAQELERVIEGDEFDERPDSPNSDSDSVKDDEAEEDTRRVDPTQGKTKRVIKNPRFILNPARLTGPRGIQVIPEHFKDFKFKGKGHEKEDLDMVLKKLEHWAYRLYPKFEFSDCLKKIETLGKKRPVMVHLHKIRNDQIISEETVVQKDSSDEEGTASPPQEDEFDKLLQQQIELARATPMSVKKTQFTTPSIDRSSMMPKATSSPSINEEQRDRMLRNRKLAEERRLTRLKNNSLENNDQPNHVDEVSEENKSQEVLRKHNKSNVLDSSSDEEVMSNHTPITVEMHTKNISLNNDNTHPTELDQLTDESNQNQHKSVSRKQKTNVMDSSSDEDEMAINAINESVTVEVHKDTGNAIQTETKNSEDPTKNLGVKNIDIANTVNIEVENDSDKNYREVEKSEGSPAELVKNYMATDVNVSKDNQTEKEHMDVAKNTAVQSQIQASNNQMVVIPSDTTIHESSKEGSKDSELDDDIMDVDFNDGF